MSITMKQVQTDQEIGIVVRAAYEIWNEYWPSRIGQEQTDYMVSTMQGTIPITHDIRDRGYLYYLIYNDENELVGYAAALEEDFTNAADDPHAIAHGTAINEKSLRRLFISKIYLFANQRGKHYASRVMNFFEQKCRDEKIPCMYLTVNRENKLAIRAYNANGFVGIEDIDMPIGSGFYMYDHIMYKPVD